MTLCVYALTSPIARRLRATGLDDERLRIVAAGQVAAIVGELRREPRVTAANLTTYAGVIERLHRSLPALVPARFGTCMVDLDELMFVLRMRAASLSRALRHVRGRSQMTVRIVHPTTASSDHVAATFKPTTLCRPQMETTAKRPSARSPTRGTRYLRSRAAAIDQARAVPGFAPLRDAVRRCVRDERVENRGRSTVVYHLVPNGAIASYRRSMARAAATADLPVIVTGPFAAYAFAD